jgi:putative ABC transport system ATP-binding protein
LFGLNERAGTTLLLVTHDPEIARRCGMQVKLRAGRVEEIAGGCAPARTA